MYIHWPRVWSLKIMRTINQIQIEVDELKIIIDIINKKAPCNFLIFGLGYDSIFWKSINHSGKTVFIEDNNAWIQKILKQDNRLQVYLVDYKSQRTQWQALLNSPQSLNIDLPKDIEDGLWDIILVDAPEGGYDDKPGRMKSIFNASRLERNGTDIFVHDCDRQVESVYCDQFLKERNLKATVGKLRHYHLKIQ